jgi:hypothetical protein
MKDIRVTMSSLSQRLEQKASFQNVRNLEQQLNEYAKITNMELVKEEVSTKANDKELKRLIGDFELHIENFSDLKKRFNTTVDTQHKLQDNTKDISITLESKINKVETNMQTNQVDVLGRLSQLRSQIND